MSATTPSPDTAALLARLPGVRAWTLTVAGAEHVTPAVRRLHLRGDDLSALAYQPGQDVMVRVPLGGPAFLRRRYTIRGVEDDGTRLDVDVVLHGNGPGARWAGSVQPGDAVEVIGPRGKITLADDADWHIFAGDDAAVPVTLTMMAALGARASAVAVLEVAGPDEEQPLDRATTCRPHLQWVHRHGDPGTGTALVDAVADVPLPGGTGQAYLAGELHQVAAVRHVLLERGMDPARIAHKAYWRHGRSNAAHGEPERPASA